MSVSNYENQFAVYGSDFDSALHLAIKHGPPEAALALIENGANVDFPNAKVCSFVLPVTDVFLFPSIYLNPVVIFTFTAFEGYNTIDDRKP